MELWSQELGDFQSLTLCKVPTGWRQCPCRLGERHPETFDTAGLGLGTQLLGWLEEMVS